jgi:predicted DNA-binding transcriptional regulator AlpA
MPKPNRTKPKSRHSVTSAVRRAVAQAMEPAKPRRRAGEPTSPDLRVLDGVPVTAVLPAEGLVKLATVLSVYPVGESTWWAGIKAGTYPRPVHIGVKGRAWRVSDIRALIRAAADAEPGTQRLPRAASHAEFAAEG